MENLPMYRRDIYRRREPGPSRDSAIAKYADFSLNSAPMSLLPVSTVLPAFLVDPNK
jgi:hypothetical protein